MPRRKRTYNLRRIKATWPYTVQEIAELLGIHKNAILRWLKNGLNADRDHRPYLVRGSELIRFLSARQSRTRKKCRQTEFYCFKCRTTRESYLGIADIVIESPIRMRLSALCETCSTKINKVQSVQDLAKIREMFHVQQLTGEHILERADPSLERDLET
jgi:excisionase family DNA binding protein